LIGVIDTAKTRLTYIPTPPEDAAPPLATGICINNSSSEVHAALSEHRHVTGFYSLSSLRKSYVESGLAEWATHLLYFPDCERNLPKIVMAGGQQRRIVCPSVTNSSKIQLSTTTAGASPCL
jgi:hypothetical protein